MWKAICDNSYLYELKIFSSYDLANFVLEIKLQLSSALICFVTSFQSEAASIQFKP